MLSGNANALITAIRLQHSGATSAQGIDVFELLPDDVKASVVTEVRVVEESVIYDTNGDKAVVRDHYDYAMVETVAFLAYDLGIERMKLDMPHDEGFVGELSAVIEWGRVLHGIAKPYWDREDADFYITCEGLVLSLVAFMNASKQWPKGSVIYRDAIGALFDALTPFGREEMFATLKRAEDVGGARAPGDKTQSDILLETYQAAQRLHTLLDGEEWDSDLGQQVTDFFKEAGFPEFSDPHDVAEPAKHPRRNWRAPIVDGDYAVTRWGVEDVQEKRPNWSRAKCIKWLSDNEGRMSDRLVELGWEVMEALLDFDTSDGESEG